MTGAVRPVGPWNITAILLVVLSGIAISSFLFPSTSATVACLAGNSAPQVDGRTEGAVAVAVQERNHRGERTQADEIEPGIGIEFAGHHEAVLKRQGRRLHDRIECAIAPSARERELLRILVVAETVHLPVPVEISAHRPQRSRNGSGRSERIPESAVAVSARDDHERVLEVRVGREVDVAVSVDVAHDAGIWRVSELAEFESGTNPPVPFANQVST